MEREFKFGTCVLTSIVGGFVSASLSQAASNIRQKKKKLRPNC